MINTTPEGVGITNRGNSLYRFYLPAGKKNTLCGQQPGKRHVINCITAKYVAIYINLPLYRAESAFCSGKPATYAFP